MAHLQLNTKPNFYRNPSERKFGRLDSPKLNKMLEEMKRSIDLSTKNPYSIKGQWKREKFLTRSPKHSLD